MSEILPNHLLLLFLFFFLIFIFSSSSSFFFFLELGFELRASHLQGRSSTLEPHFAQEPLLERDWETAG
jgi:hypothetical protein